MRILFSTAVFVTVLASCATTNLDQAPDWSRNEQLPAGDEFVRYRDGSAFHVFAVKGTGATVEDAYRNAKANAKAVVERDVYLGEASKDFEWIPDGIPGRIQDIESFQGFDPEKKHSFVLCAYDKQPAFAAGVEHVEKNVVGFGQMLADGVELELVGEFEVVLAMIRREMKIVESLSAGSTAKFAKTLAAHERGVAKIVQAKADALVRTDDERKLRDAKYRLAKFKHFDVSAQLKKIEKKLPCKVCKSRLNQTDSLASSLAMHIGSTAEMSSTDALQGVRDIADFNTYTTHSCYYYQSRLNMDCLELRKMLVATRANMLRRIAVVGDNLAKSGKLAQRERALAVFQSAYPHSKPYFSGRIQSVKRTLPCKSCASGDRGKCTTCTGKGGKHHRCQKCSGNSRYKGYCNTCRGDGQRQCGTCSGKGKVSYRCNSCRGGSVRCQVCSGGAVREQCDSCYGTGQQANFMSPGGGMVRCRRCSGRGKVRRRCSTCRGRAKVACDSCGGSARRTKSCSNCRGDGRAGRCSKCEGRRTLYYPCRSCKEGRVWKSCAKCRGKGQCTTCGGAGHRK